MLRSGPRPSTRADTIERTYRQTTTRSAELAATARALLPSGVVHDSRYMQPYSIYVERAAGAYKWDVDGNRYIDYFGGHGSLILGHNHPEVTGAIQSAVADGTHFAANPCWLKSPSQTDAAVLAFPGLSPAKIFD